MGALQGWKAPVKNHQWRRLPQNTAGFCQIRHAITQGNSSVVSLKQPTCKMGMAA
jgi:hypothetical protein